MSLVTISEQITLEVRPMQYPTLNQVEESLELFAQEIGEAMDSPFRVSMVARHGGKAPVYSIVIRCLDQDPIRKKLAEVLNRKFSMGGTSLALDANEAQVISQYQRKPAQQVALASPQPLKPIKETDPIDSATATGESTANSFPTALPRCANEPRATRLAQFFLRPGGQLFRRSIDSISTSWTRVMLRAQTQLRIFATGAVE